MPIYEVTQEETGITLELEGERPPKKEDIDRAFAFAGAQKYANAPVYGVGGSVLQAPPSLLEQAKAVAPSFARVAAPLAFGTPMPQDVATIGRTLQKVTGQEPKPEMLDAASRIDREGMMALLSASPEKRELGARLGSQLADIARIVSPGVSAIPQSATRAGGEVAGQVAADLLSPMNLMTLGIGGAARGAAAIPEVVEGVSRAGAISDIRRAAEAARASQILEEGIPAALAPEVTRGAIGSTGTALETLADPNVSPEEKLKTSLEAAVSTLFAAGLGAQVGRTFGFKRGVTQAEVLEGIASRKQTVGEAINKVSGLIDEMDRLVEPPTLERIREGFTELRQQLNPDEPFVYRPETIGEGPRAQAEGGMLPPREVVAEEVVQEGTPLRNADEILAERLRARDERIAAEQEKIAAEEARVPLETVNEKLSRALEARDKRLAAEAVAEALESGAAQGESPRVTRSAIEKSLGMKEKPVGQAVAESTIFNEVWNKALEETQGKFRQKAETVAQRLEGLRAEVEPGVGANPFPQLMGAAWNGALSVAQAVIRAGGTVADGVAAGIRYAKQNFRESFDENEFSNQLTRTVQTPAEIKAPPVMEPRRFAERVAAAPGVPPVIREAVAASPEAVYRQQNVAAEVADASTKTDSQLAADIIDPESNTRVISGMEQFNRQISSGDMEGATKTALSLSKSGTTWGQLINQFKLLKSASREGVIQLVTKSLEQNKRKPMTPKQVDQLGTAMDQFKIAQDAATAARVEGRGAFESNNPAEIQSAIDRINAADTLRMEADVSLNETIARINPSSAGDLFVSLVQGSVMAPISIVRNVVGNAINLPLRETADLTSSLIDMALFGSKNNAYNVRSRILNRIKTFGESLPAAQRTLLKGSNANPYELGTDIGNPLNFQRAWKNLYEAMSGEYRGNVARNIVEATVGVMPDIMLRLTQATDIPFKQANRAAIVSELGRMRGLTEGQIKLALKDPELALISDQARANGRKGFTADDINTIETEAARSVFQQDNSATRMVAGINRFIKQETGSLGYVPYRLISLFQKTPINVAAEALQFTPAGVLRNWSKMSVRDREQAVGRLIVGSMVMGAFSYLYDKGIVTPNLDTPGETNKARELAKSGGVMPPGTLNVSALRRLAAGQDPSFQPGDTVKDLSALGTMGALGIIVGSSKRIAERSRTDEPDFFAIGKGSALSGINFVMEQQFLKGTSDLIKLMSEESGASLERFVKNLAVTAGSPIAPSTLGSIRRAEREYLPVTGGEGIIKDTVNELNQRFAALGLAIPGTKDPNAMPVRRDLWGEAVEQTPKGNNPWVYQFLSFAKNREIDADPLNASIYRVWRRTADNKALPSVPNPQLTYKNQTFERMTPEQYDRYAQLVGFYRRKFSERAFMSGAYQQRGDEARIKLLSEAYDNGLKLGKLRFLKELRESGQTLTPVAPRRGFEE